MADDLARLRRYPLFCLDSTDESSGTRYRGPFDTRDEAWEERRNLPSVPAPELRKCRRISLREVLPRGACNPEELHNQIHKIIARACKQHPGRTWAACDDEYIAARFGGNVVSDPVSELSVDVDALLDMYICEGDE